ncbi:MAG: hypothetical protein JSV36_18490 [Anaerolineae bacterium]|nr:MAG: hypothetical protein JSV36_18490 [Anaerolineae bacterium]
MAKDDLANSRSESKPRPYAPSWVNHLTAWVDRQSWSSWFFYLGLWLVLVIILVATPWIEGAYPIGKVFPAQLFIPAMIALFLGMIHFLDSRADAALTTLRPALTATEEECDLLRHQLTTMPAWPTVVASLAMVGVIVLLWIISGERDSNIEALAASPIGAILLSAVYWIGWWIVGAFIYHTIHQLRVINRIYTEHTRVNLLAISPLYAFSSVTAPTAVTLAIASYGWTALNPENLSDPIDIAFTFLFTVLALAAFAWPLLGTRRLMAKEKRQMLDQVSLRLEAAFVELHQRVDKGKLEVDDLAKVISLLETERDMLKGISTWPWQPETLRYLVTALVLPLLLWIIQYVLQLILGS